MKAAQAVARLRERYDGMHADNPGRRMLASTATKRWKRGWTQCATWTSRPIDCDHYAQYPTGSARRQWWLRTLSDVSATALNRASIHPCIEGGASCGKDEHKLRSGASLQDSPSNSP